MHYSIRQHRRRSFDQPDHAHELTFCCYKRFPFLKAAGRVCGWLANSIRRSRERRGFMLWAYVFMPEHVHLIIHPGENRIASILKDIKQPVGREALRYLDARGSPWRERLTRIRGGRVERLFWEPGGGYDRNITEPTTLASMLNYLHDNPARRRLVARASDWRWSSSGWFAGTPLNELQPDPVPVEWH